MRKSINGRSPLGITLVSLVVTIIILIILAGVSINLALGENGIITITKQAKENTELTKIEEETVLNELYMQIESEGGSTSYDSIAKLTEFKKSIADYIEEAGGVKPEYTADATTFGESIKGIVAEVTKNATATADDIANGKTAYVNGELITGNSNKTYIKYVDLNFLNIGGNGKTQDISVDLTDIPNYDKITLDNITTVTGIGDFADSSGNLKSVRISLNSYSNGTLIIRGTSFWSTYGEYATNVPIVITF